MEGGAFSECLKRKSSGMWGMEFLRRGSMFSLRAFSRLWNPFECGFILLPSFVKKCVEFGPSGLVRSFDPMDGTFMMRLSSSSSAAEGGSGIVLAFLSLSLGVTRHGFTENGS